MTVCIGAICDRGNAIVAVSDSKVSFGEFSAENLAIKANQVGWEWGLMYSGDDVSCVQRVDDHLQVLLGKRKHRRPPLSGDLAMLVDEAYRMALQEEIESSVLRKFNFTCETFRKNGKQQCSEAQHATICQRIDAVNLGNLQLLVYGFEQGGDERAHLWHISGGAAPRNFDAIGMWAIGSGARAALAMMAHHADQGHIRFSYDTLAKTVYCALAAKFMAESATDVGKSTFVKLLRRKSNEIHEMVNLGDDDVDVIRAHWVEHGAPKLPSDFVAKEMPKLLRSGWI